MSREEKLIYICADIMNIGADSLTLETTRDELDELDSLSVIQIIAEMQSTFQCEIDEKNLETTRIEKIGDFLYLLPNEP